MNAKVIVFALSALFVSSSLFANEVKSLPSVNHQQQIQKIDLNTADAQVLTGSFKGIGNKRAEAIVKYRQVHGPFKAVGDLANVRGIGKAFIKKNLSQLETVFSV